MATTGSTRKRAASKSSAAAAEVAAVKEEPIVAVKEEPTVTVKEEPEKFVPKEIDPTMYITVVNGFHGRLIYKSSKTREKFVWSEFGAEQEMELRELRNAKGSAKAFFRNNWFMFHEEDAWVIDYLGLGQFYKHAVSVDGFDDLFTKTPAAIKKAIGDMSKGQKRSVTYRAIELIGSGEIDSRKTIAALEDALGVDLIEK